MRLENSDRSLSILIDHDVLLGGIYIYTFLAVFSILASQKNVLIFHRGRRTLSKFR